MKWEISQNTFISCDHLAQESDIILFGAPFDGTTSFRPGTRFGPDAIRRDSFGLETYSPYLDRDLLDYKVCDCGDLDLVIGDLHFILRQIEDFTREIVEQQKIPVMLGGEHLVTFPAVKAVKAKYDDLVVVHLDAHADLRKDYLGNPLSHATVMNLCCSVVGQENIYQYGIRSGEAEEFKFGKAKGNFHLFNLNKIKDLSIFIQRRPVYLTIDLDVLDPSVFPGTGTPEAGGVSFLELNHALQQLGKLNIVGADLCELSPIYDPSGNSTMVACKVLREALLNILINK